MTQSNHQLVRDFFAAIMRGEVPDDLLAADMTFWSINSGTAVEKARFQGAMKILALIFSGRLIYDIRSLTAEEDRVVAEVQSHGALPDGEPFDNSHLFLFRIRDGQVASVMEFMNQLLVREKLAPLIQAAMTQNSSV